MIKMIKDPSSQLENYFEITIFKIMNYPFSEIISSRQLNKKFSFYKKKK